MYKKIVFLIIFVVELNIHLFSQEVLLGLPNNPVIKNYIDNSKSKEKYKAATDTLKLPFFDDFSNSNIYPDQLRWVNNFVFINQTNIVIDSANSYLPPSIGVATFDALDETGNLYNLSVGVPAVADFLTSKPIDLNYPNDTTIFLSFYFQPVGLGYAMLPEDSLIVEFKDIINNVWVEQWFALGDTSVKPFKFVRLPVRDKNFLQNGFQFRFKNYVTLQNVLPASKIVNQDFWNVDYIKLDRNRTTDTIMHDIAYVLPISSPLKNYQQMPWNHFKTSPSKFLSGSSYVKYKNNDDRTRYTNDRLFSITDLLDNTAPFLYKFGQDSISPTRSINYKIPLSYNFTSTSTDSAIFLMQSSYTSDVFDSVCNNSVSRVQKFKNYYAYDDGTAEDSWGLIGDGSINGRLAYRFYIAKTDSLQAIQFYFTPALNLANQQYFQLIVWNAQVATTNGVTDTIPLTRIFQQIGYLPEFTNQLNQFYTYPLFGSNNNDTSIVLAPGYYFFGWEQTTEDFLSVGLDRNSDAMSNVYFNVENYWEHSRFKGALMIRPVFGNRRDVIYTGIATPTVKASDKFAIYPNPANDLINIAFDGDKTKINNVELYNTIGQLLYRQNNLNAIDVRNIKAGFYLLKINNDGNSITKKILIGR